MEEKQRLTDPEREAGQQESETAPIDIASLPLIHLYRPQGGLFFLPDEALQQLEDNEAIPSTLVDQDRQRFRNEHTRPLTEPQVTHQQPAAKMGILTVTLVLLVNMAILLSAILATLLQTVTIVIVPKTQQITEQVTLVSLQSRLFSPLTFTQTKTVPATGKGYQPATAATGFITFYNAAPFVQTIYAGELLTSADGTQVVTTQNATIPAGNFSGNGQGTVSAHAVNTGVAGNIAVGAISGTCCKEYILVRNNSAFTGGQDARAYQIVTQADIHGAVSSLLPTVTQAITTSFAKQVRPSETLTSPVCSQTITASPQVQQEAASVTVSIQTNIVQLLSQREPGYRLKAYFQLAPLSASLYGNRLSISSTYQATYRYQFTRAETDKVLSEIKGKQTRQVARLLEQLPGVEHITITTLANQDTLPIDKTYIHLLIVEG